MMKIKYILIDCVQKRNRQQTRLQMKNIILLVTFQMR